jgi:WD40 repeat protein
LAWLPDGSLVSSGLDGRVLHWKSGTSTEIASFEAPIDVMRVSPNGTLLALGGQNLGVVLWDLSKGEALGLEPAGHTMSSWERGKGTRDFQGWLTRAGLLEFTEDGSSLTAVLGYDTLATWEVATGRLALCEDKPTELYYAAGGAIDPRGLLYVAMGFVEETEISLYSCRSGQRKAIWNLPLELVESSMAVANEHLFIACDDGTLVALDALSGEVADRVQLPARCLSLEASGNGTVVLGSESGALFHWRPGEALKGPFDLPNGGLWCTAVALSPCGKKIATGHGNGVCLQLAW